MKALEKQARGAGHLAVVDKPEPELRAGEVLLEVAACGVCGTDLHIQDDEFVTDPPVTLGHEISGTVRRIGPGADPAWLDARVVSEAFYSSCGHCRACREARPNMCPQKRALGTFVNGGFASLVAVPQRNLHRIPDWLDQHAAALTEPLACVCNALLDPPAIAPADRVLVTGPGPIGILAAQVARASGGDVLLLGTAKDAARLEVAAGLGLATTAERQEITPMSFDVVVECSGSEGGIATALDAVRKRGRYVQVGVVGRPVTVLFDHIFYKELRVSSGQGAPPPAWLPALALIESLRVLLPPLLTAAVPLDEWVQVFDDIRAGRGVKYVLDPNG